PGPLASPHSLPPSLPAALPFWSCLSPTRWRCASWRTGSSPLSAAGSDPPARSPSVLRDAFLVAGKDLRVEGRSRVATNQVAPFALLVLVLFAFALDPDRGLLRRAAPGLFWLTVLFAAVLAIQRAFALEAAEGSRDALRLS